MFLVLLIRNFDKMGARRRFSAKYCRAAAENARKPIVFMHNEAMSILLGSQNVLNLVYFRAEYVFGV